MRKITRKGLIRKLDKIFSLKVREIGRCEFMGKDTISCSKQLQCAHIIGRGRKVIRWDLQNALCICSGHHVYYTNNPERWRNMLMNFYPERLAYLEVQAEKVWDKNLDKVLMQLTDWEEIKKKLESIKE